MSAIADGYDGYYQARLWESLPEIYREADAAGADVTGPLRELLNRIGIQVAVVRRSVDALWADQSIETCADWVIPYIGDLIAARLVTGLDPRGQRLDVAYTIHWRRRKGMLATVDAVARDITGWDVHVLEAFRRLARTRHNLDPPVGTHAVGIRAGGGLRAAEDLIQPITRTPAGGLADLRSAPGALLSGGPFDEAFHHADLRRGRGMAGWYGIEKLAVYCWRLLSFGVTGATPVRVPGPDDEYVFDPTGREIPLFLPPSPDSAKTTGTTSAWQVPGPLTAAVARVMTRAGIPPAYAVTGGTASLVRPEAGRFRLSAPTGEAVTVSFRYGFGGPIGAGTAVLSGDTPLHAAGEKRVAGGAGLDQALAGAHAGDTVTIGDSRTYTAVANVTWTAGGDAAPAPGNPPAPPGPSAPLTVRARPGQRPVVRLPERRQLADREQWVFKGGEGARLTLDGLFISGGDIVLQGSFDHVKIVGCTFDPGSLAEGANDPAGQDPASCEPCRAPAGNTRGSALAVAQSVDGRALLPTRVWIEPAPGRLHGLPDTVRCLEIDRSILGPIRTRSGGLAERIVITDSILQGLRTSADAEFTAADVFDPVPLYDQFAPVRATADRPRTQPHPLSALISRWVRPGIRKLLRGRPPPESAREPLAQALNALLDRDIYSPGRFTGVALNPETDRLLDRDAERAWLNRLLLEDAYPLALAPAACAAAEAEVHLNRVTVLGRVIAQRLHATDSILAGFTVAEDPEDGCFRYSAALAGSRLPHHFNSAQLSGAAALFTSTVFGRPGYGQLLDTADRAIVARTPGMTLLAGSSTGSQLGAFPAQIVPVKERALRIKYNEYLPLGLVPVIVPIT